jgi:hypothetical protein
METGLTNDRVLARDLVGLGDLMAKLLRVKEHPEFGKLVPHLRYLTTCNLLLNQRTAILDREANKVIELYWAAVCLQAGGTNLEMDDGGEAGPDVLIDLDGRRWAFECKTLQVASGLALRDNLVKAISQISVPATAHVGLPIINGKNIIPHEEVWTAPGDSPDYDLSLNVMEAAAHAVDNELTAKVGKEEVCKLFAGNKSLPGCLWLLQSTGLLHPGALFGPVACLLTDLVPVTFCDARPFAPPEKAVLERLNRSAWLGFGDEDE